MTERGKLSWFRCHVALVFSTLEMNLNQGGIAWLVWDCLASVDHLIYTLL